MINTSLSARIMNAIVKSRPIGLNGLPKSVTNPVFSLKNPNILEAIPDKYIGTDTFVKLSQLEGKSLNEVLPVIDTIELSVANSCNSVSKTDLYEELAKLYEKVAKEKTKLNEHKSAQIFNDFAQMSRNRQFTEKDLYSKLYDQLYNNLRKSEYPVTKLWNPQIAEITGKNNKYMMVQESGGWHYRIPRNRHEFGWSRGDETIDRISVNANTDQELIAKLDEYFGAGKVKGYYKTPSDAASWLERHDPITVYLQENANPNILKDIEVLTRPYIRSTKDVLVGHKFAPGLALEKSPSTQDIENILAQIENINPTAAKAIREELVGNLLRKGLPKDSPLSASSGQMTAMKQFIDLLSK